MMYVFVMRLHQMEFVERFSPSQEENLCIWHHILLRCLCTDARARVEEEVLSKANDVLREWQDSGYRLGNISRMVRTGVTLTSQPTACFLNLNQINDMGFDFDSQSDFFLRISGKILLNCKSLASQMCGLVGWNKSRRNNNLVLDSSAAFILLMWP